jgi:RHS repeat-associated protein
MTYLANGRLHQFTDARSQVTTYSYNPQGDAIQVTNPLSQSAFFSYDDVGRALTATDFSGAAQTFAYDDNDRLLWIRQDNLPGQPKREFTYDAFGQTAFSDELGRAISIELNELGLPLAMTDALGNRSQTEYDPSNNPVITTDAMGRVTKQSYDDANRPLVLIDPRGKKATRAYDDNGNLISFTDKKNNLTRFDYDTNNRLVTTTDALGKKITQARDAVGRTVTITNARSQQVHLTYDADGRMTEKKYQPDPPAPAVAEATFSYDAVGNITQRVDAWGTTLYIYDAANRVTSMTYPTGLSATFTYTPNGQLASITYPGGLVASYDYDGRSAVTSPTARRSGTLTGHSPRSARVASVTLTQAAISKTLTYQYDAAGMPSATQRPDLAPDTLFTYDAAGRMTGLAHNTSGGASLISRTLTLDASGNIIAEALTGSEVLAAPLPEATTFVYDKANQLTRSNTATYSYDGDGNLTAISGNRFSATYSPENRPTQITRQTLTGPQTLTLTYDGAGMRVKSAITGGATTQYHYTPDGQLLFTTDGAGVVQTLCIWKGPSLAALVTGPDLASSLLFPLPNLQGSIEAYAKLDGTLDTLFAYSPYGALAHDSAPSAINPGLFSYVGALGVQDEGEGLFYMRNRFYDASIGRFLQRDPTGLEGGINLYAYANSSPMTFVDPYGLWSLKRFAAGAANMAYGGFKVVTGVVAIKTGVFSAWGVVSIGLGAKRVYDGGKLAYKGVAGAPDDAAYDTEAMLKDAADPSGGIRNVVNAGSEKMEQYQQAAEAEREAREENAEANAGYEDEGYTDVGNGLMVDDDLLY